jgi:hypothetical protein
MEAQKKMTLPKVGLFACFSGGSNSGSLAGIAALEAVRRLGNETVGICSLPAVLNRVPRHLLAEKGIVPDVYLNLEENLHLTKQGAFQQPGIYR